MNKEFLTQLLKTYSPSGFEKEGVECFIDYIGKGEMDKLGNGFVSVGNGNHLFLLSAHIDEISLRVQNIDDNGFIYFIKNGGVDEKVLLGSNVSIINNKGVVKGVIGKCPIHIEDKSKREKVDSIHEMKIDIGASSKEEAMNLVDIGDEIIINGEFIELGETRFASRGLDDKLGVFIVAEVIKQLQLNEQYGIRELKHLTVCGCACTQEETSGSGGVKIGKLNPEFSIDYDVHFASDDGYASPNQYGKVELGKGGAICHSVDCNKKFVQLIKNICDKYTIPYQSFSLKSGGTNTVLIKKSAYDCETALLSIPLRNMHTQVEVADYRDVQCLIDMTLNIIYEIDKNYDN